MNNYELAKVNDLYILRDMNKGSKVYEFGKDKPSTITVQGMVAFFQNIKGDR